MKLRLENGNFSIKALFRDTTTTPKLELITTTLPKGLSYTDFIGTVVDFGIFADVVTMASAAPDYDGYVLLRFSHAVFEIMYNPATGELSLDGPDDSEDPDDPVDPDNP